MQVYMFVYRSSFFILHPFSGNLFTIQITVDHTAWGSPKIMHNVSNQVILEHIQSKLLHMIVDAT
jgi:hypothetical protein